MTYYTTAGKDLIAEIVECLLAALSPLESPQNIHRTIACLTKCVWSSLHRCFVVAMLSS